MQSIVQCLKTRFFAPPVPIAAVVLVTVALTGCRGPFVRIDARTQAMMEERSALLGAQAAAPNIGFRDQPMLDRASPAYIAPDTNSPSANELSFSPADEARNVEDRLRQFHERTIAGDAIQLTLAEALRIAQESSRDFRQAEEDYILAAIRLLIEEHRWGPRFFADTSVVASGQGTDGSFQHAVDIVNSLRATKRLPYGGEVEARLVWNATEQLRQQATGRYNQSSRIVLSGNIPLLRGAGMVAREDLIQRQRDLVYAARTFERFRRELLVDIASDYFSLVSSQNRIKNQILQIEGLRNLEEQTAELVSAGRLRAFQQDLTRSQLLGAQSSLANLQESFQLQVDRFKVRLSIPLDQPLDIVAVQLNLPEPEATIDEVTAAALAYRLDLQNRRDQVDDAKRAVANARNQLLPDLNVSADLGIPTDPDAREGGFGLDPEELDYSAGIALGWPIDRETERLSLRSSLISAQRSERGFDQTRDNVIVDARSALRAIELARLRLNLAEQQVIINMRRLDEQRTRSDEVNPQAIVDTENELNNARNARDQAASDLKVAVLRFLLQTGQLRVTRDGWIAPPEGMSEVTEERVSDTNVDPYALDEESP